MTTALRQRRTDAHADPASPTNAPRYTTDFVYRDRAEKAAYIARKYAPILRGRILDVGCDQRQLAAHLPPSARYTGLDLAAPADVRLDLDRENLPFATASFDTVLCCDVLEHLERLHEVFDELCRVSADRVIVSLPNSVRALLMSLVCGEGGRLKHYGLPPEPVQDRHRWFFGFAEAAEFCRTRGERNGFTVEQLDAESEGLPPWLDRCGRDRLDHPNSRMGTMWCVLRRREPKPAREPA